MVLPHFWIVITFEEMVFLICQWESLIKQKCHALHYPIFEVSYLILSYMELSEIWRKKCFIPVYYEVICFSTSGETFLFVGLRYPPIRKIGISKKKKKVFTWYHHENVCLFVFFFFWYHQKSPRK